MITLVQSHADYVCGLVAAAATIVSAAMAERTKFSGYLIYSSGLSAIIYPVFGSWAWGSLFNGQGWLEDLSFIDFTVSSGIRKYKISKIN